MDVNNHMRIIGFTGKKGHGKSTASTKAQSYLESQGIHVIRINFKDSLVSVMKKGASGLLLDIASHYKMTIEELFNEKPPIMRRFMQFVGTEMYREMDDAHWINEWARKLDPYKRSDVVVIVDDVRFQNEFDTVVREGGVVYRIVATNKPVPTDQHQSETEMDGFDCVNLVANSREELEAIVEEQLTVM